MDGVNPKDLKRAHACIIHIYIIIYIPIYMHVHMYSIEYCDG